ncbi:MAG: DUF4381 domain-containing protein, partial [Planctomycetota bacterium]
MRPQSDSEAASLARLHDIELPEAVSLWPSAPGWWLVAGALGSAAVLAGWVWWDRHRSLAYRRAALRELSELRASGELRALPSLLKRVALAAHPRHEVAALSGP